MLYYKFKNYEEFKDMFGIIKHGNGVCSRKNKILLAYIRNKRLLHEAIETNNYTLLHISSMAELKKTITRTIIISGHSDMSLRYVLELDGDFFYSRNFETDELKGLCKDGDTRSIRYINHENGGKVFKMKAGKLYRSLILETEFGRTLPEQIVTYLCEEFSADWQGYTHGRLPKNKLHVDKDFERIYSSQAISYLGFFVAAMAIGYFTSRPGMIKVWDTTRTKLNSLTENSQRVLAKLTGPVTITNYVNLLDNKSYRYLPIMKKANETIFEPYCLAKPDLQVKYVYYYDFAPNGVANNPKFQGKTVDEMRDYMTMIYNLNPHLFKSPAEIRQIIDLREEQNTFVRIMETQDGKRTFIRDFEDMDATPSEAEITAAIKKMISTPPTVAFIKGDGEREVSKSGDRDYSNFSIEKYSRAALINQGFDVCEIDISHGDTIPSLINIVVLAEMRTPLTEKGENQLEAYLARGGNLFILTDTGRQEVMNPFLSKLGIKMEEYQLAQSSADFSPNLILAKATRESEKLTFGFKDDFPKYDLRVSMPGCVALTCSDNDYGFQYTPILETNAKGVWIEKEQTDLQESPVECNASAGEKEQTYITAYALSRQLKDKEQRIIISGDADCISNTELTLSREGYRSGNFNLIIESFRWLSGGEFPIDIRRPHCTDNKLSIGVKDIGTMKTIFIIIIPAILLLIGVGIWFFRRRN